jgi:hypothetical protein
MRASVGLCITGYQTVVRKHTEYRHAKYFWGVTKGNILVDSPSKNTMGEFSVSILLLPL